MSAAPAAYYDGLLDDPQNAYGLPLEDSPYRELYKQAAQLVPEGKSVVDLGSGSGRFASLIIPKCSAYLGIDFSISLTEAALRYNAPLPTDAAFWLADFTAEPIPPADVYVLLEVLEHLDDDLGLLRRLPSGALCVCSVPSFDSHSHVRRFPSGWDVFGRYGSLLNTNVLMQQIPAKAPGACFHLWAAERL